MVVSLNPVVSSNTTGVIPSIKAKHPNSYIAQAGSDAFVSSKHADVAFKGAMANKAMGGIMTVLSFLGLNSCGPNDGPLSPIEPDPVKKTNMELFMEAPLKQKYAAVWDSLGFFNSQLKSGNTANTIKYFDERIGENIELTIDETKSTANKLTGTQTHSDKNGSFAWNENIEITGTADKKGIDMKVFTLSGEQTGVDGYKIADNVKKDGVKQSLNGELTWILNQTTDAKTIQAEAIENGVKNGFKSVLRIIK